MFSLLACSNMDGNDLLAAAADNDVDEIDRIYAEGHSLDVYTNSGQSLIAYALHHHAQDVAMRLIQYGADIDERATDGHTPLTSLCSTDQHFPAEIQLLLSEEADPDEKNDFRETAIIGAAENGMVGNLRALMEGGADINARCRYGSNALTVAIIADSAQCFHLLLENGASPDGPNVYRCAKQRSPLCAALEKYDDEEKAGAYIEPLLAAGARINQQAPGCIPTVFLHAVAMRHAMWANEFIERGCHIAYRHTVFMPLQLAWALDTSYDDEKVAILNKLIFGSGECFRFDAAYIENMHPIAQCVLHDCDDMSLTAIVRRFLRRYLLQFRVNLIVQVRRLEITHVMKDYLLFH